MITLLGWLIFALWFRLWVLIFLKPLPSLEDAVSGGNSETALPKVSVLVPACNEAQDIGANLTSLLALDYPALELIAINDRSTDRTGEIMDDLAEQYPQLKVFHIEDLPEGWLGKNHALHMGAAASSGEFILMTDGDIFFHPDTLTLTMRYVQAQQLDHFCLFPQFIPGSLLENAFLCHFAILFFSQLESWKLGKDPKTYVGVGAFNLVRRSVYQQAGGHQPLRLEVIDDVMLGKLMVDQGAKTGALLGQNHLRVRWHVGFKGFLKGLEKNGFAAMRYSWLRLTALTVMSLLLFYLPYGVLFFTEWHEASGYVLTLGLVHFLYGYFGWKFQKQWYVTFMVPVAVFVGLIIFWNSAWVTFKQQGISWRGTFYKLKDLKKHTYV